jgi:hypothetical protein
MPPAVKERNKERLLSCTGQTYQISNFSEGLITPTDKLCLHLSKFRVRSPAVRYASTQITLRISEQDFLVRFYLRYPYLLYLNIRNADQFTYSKLNSDSLYCFFLFPISRHALDLNTKNILPRKFKTL